MSPDEIRIGLLLSDTGLTSDLFRGARHGVDGRLGLLNESGGIHGRKVVYTWRDDESDARANQRAARELVEGEEVFALLTMTTVMFGSAEYLNSQRVPVVGLAVEPVWTQYDNMFSYSNLVPTAPPRTTLGDFARARGGTRAALVISDTSVASRIGGDRMRRSVEGAGIPVVATLNYVPGATSPERLGQQIRSLGVDVLISTLAAEDYAHVYMGARAAGARLKVTLSPSGYDRELLRKYGQAISGATFFVSYTPFESTIPAHEQYRQAMVKYAPQLRDPAEEIALASYIATDLMLRGLLEAGECPTRENFIMGLAGVDDYNADGLLPGFVDFSVDNGMPAKCYTFVQVDATGAGFEILEPHPVCGTPLPD